MKRRNSRVPEVCLIDLDRRGDLVEPDIPCDDARYTSYGEGDRIVNAVCLCASATIAFPAYRHPRLLRSAGTRSSSPSRT